MAPSPQPDDLRRAVEALCAFGERSTRRPTALAAAAEWVAQELRMRGFRVAVQGFPASGVVCQNVEATTAAFSARADHLLIGAHYDSAPGTPGADDNASAVAILLALAARFARHEAAHRLRFVAFANEEPPHFRTNTMGSHVFARACARAGDAIRLMVCLESLGVYFDEPGTQQLPMAIPAGLLPAGVDPTVGNFVAVVGKADSMDAAAFCAAAFRPGVPALPIELPEMELSDHVSFWDEGIPAIMLTDTAPFRNPHYHRASDTPEKLDYARMAMVTESLAAAIHGWLRTPAGG